ncbi:MAG: efflux RND transporter periplasmic adaptor subunit [Phycisphaerae bacterium]|nr:efflux RND transporter periplasmic adaptor subunit [Phycisphaerae bacterium]MCZ2399730.1 efflux RND transporter periplasmic adaptor subunit [Phycisphaerae bacterium]
MRTHAGTLLVLLLLAGGTGLVTWRALNSAGLAGRGGGPGDPVPVAVEIADIRPATLRDVRELTGTLEANTRFVVAAKVSGLLRRVAVDLGDVVDRGHVIAQIDDAEYVQAVAQAEAELAVRAAERARAQTELRRIQTDFDRIEDLQRRGVSAPVEYDEVRANLESAEAAVALADARVRQADAALELSRIRLGYATVRAEWEGGESRCVVSERFQDAGNTVAVGDPVVAVVALDPLTAVVFITERDYGRLSIGQPATLRVDAAPGRDFEAAVVRLSPSFREASRQARVELRVPNPHGLLKPGMFARVRVTLREVDAPAAVPLAALTRRDGRDVVFVVAQDGQRVRLVPVEIGVIEGGLAQVAGEGLEGRVVVLGQQLLSDNSRVSVRSGFASPAAPPAEGARP